MDVLTISQLTDSIKTNLNQTFPAVWVSGEISGLSCPSSGHLYFRLKDDRAQINAIIWSSHAARLEFEPTDGLKVVCRGGVDVYPPRGSYQLIVRQIQPQGIGALELAFRQLHAKLNAEGLFDESNKQAIPTIPRHIAVVTSPTGAAIRDFLQVLMRRWPGVRVTIVPTRVQGQGAAAEIAAAIRRCQIMAPAPEVLVVTRGGGSIEDLWAFNEEPVVRAIFESTIPVVSGVGHEIDVTLSDLVADVRALTPSEAAERLVPNRADVDELLLAAGQRLRQVIRRRLEQARTELEHLASRPVIMRPTGHLDQAAIELDYLEKSLQQSMRQRLSREREVLTRHAQRLESVSPLAVLKRGYSLTRRPSGDLIVDLDSISVGDTVMTRVANGEFSSQVTSIDSLPMDAPSTDA